jgi:hypothetical protein
MRRASLVALALLLSAGRAPAQDEPAQTAPAETPAANAEERESAATKTTPPAATPSYPKSGSQPGSPLELYRERTQAPAPSADRARSWAEEPGTDPADQALFAPRALLFVPKVVFHLVFFPIQALLTVVDRHHVVPRVRDFFYFDRAHTAGFYPSVALESGYGFSYGVGVFHNDAFGHGEELVASGRFGGRYLQAYQLLLEADRMGGSRLWFESRVRYEFQPATLFHGLGDPGETSVIPAGLGPRDASIATRFRQERFLGLLRLGGTLGTPGDLTKIGGTAIYNHRVFGPEERRFDEPSIETVYDTSRLPGFGDRVNTVEIDANLVRDTREGGPLASSGTYLELIAGGVLPVDRYRYGHFGAELAQYINLYRRTRVLVLRGAVEGVVGHEDRIPFVELPRLGGVQNLRGYVADRFRDKLAAVATVEYRYPIHELLAGALFVDAGHVGRTPNELFAFDALKRWRLDAGGGLLLHTRESMLLGLDVAYGDGLTVFFTTAPIEFFHHRERQL